MEPNNLMNILSILLQRQQCNLKVKPSEFIREMNLTTEERTETLLHCNRRLLTNFIQKGFPAFLEPSLPIIIFQNFSTENVYTIPLNILNKDKITRSFMITCEKSPYFAIHYHGKALVKVAPGISEKILIEFTPRQRKDYHHMIKINSDCGNFEIPIYAIGPRPLLDFPDEIYINNCSIRIPNTKVVCVFNIGEIDAIFTLDINGPFKVEQRSCAIKPGKNLQISVTFQSAKPGKFTTFMEITLQSGEKLYSQIHAAAENNSVSLNSNRLNFEGTYAGLSRHKELYIKNNSSHTISYRWLNGAFQKEDQDISLVSKKSTEFLHSKDNFMTEKFAKQEMRYELSKKDQCYNDLHQYLDSVREGSLLLFNHKNFHIEPSEGDILPGNSVEAQVIFMPDCGPKIYEEVALFETSGCEEVLALQLYGQGLGANICLLLQLLDVGEIFIKIKYSYEVVVANKGDIPGEIRYVPTKLDFGGVIECEPKYYQLKPREHKAFALSYFTCVKGEFIEEVTFQILESHETRRLLFKGHARYAKLEIGAKIIDFGNLPLGLPATNDLVIFNPCPIPITFYAYIKEKVEKKQDLLEFQHPASANLVDDVRIEPSVGCLEPYQVLNATIKVIAQAPKNSYDVVLETWDGLAAPSVIPITYQIKVPDITIKPSEINLSYCFVNFPYSCFIQLSNPSDYSARFSIQPQEVETYESMTVLTDLKEGIINGLMKVDIHISIMVHKVGKFSTLFKVKIMGLEDILTTTIFAEGQGPIVTAEREKLEWEKIPLFSREFRYFQLHNHSPISADFACEMVRGIPFWTVDPSKGIIGPNNSVTVGVELYITDDGNYHDMIDILIRNSSSLSVNLYATGFGNPISTDPPIYPFLDLGEIFCSSNYKKKVFLKNGGIKIRALELYQAKKKNENQSSSRFVFKFQPQKLILHPGQQQSISLEANHESVEEVKESFCFWCTEDRKRTKHKIFEGFVKAKFILFHLNFPSESLNLISYKGERAREFFNVRNDTSLAVKAMVAVTPPFKIISEWKPMDCVGIDIFPLDKTKILMEFKPLSLKDRRPKKCHGKLRFTFEDISMMYEIEITGEEKYPQLTFDVKVVDFGCICTGTTSQRLFKVKNKSPFPVKFEWKLLKGSVTLENKSYNELDGRRKNEDKNEFSLNIFDSLLRYLEKEKERYTNMMQFPEINRLFREDEDILQFLTSSVIENGISPPISWIFEVEPKYGELEPDNSMEISLLFRGYTSLEALADLQCVIDEGVSDPIQISAKSSTISYFLDKTYIDFGEKLFCQTCSENIEIKNTGAMEFYYQSHFQEKATNPTDIINNHQPCSLNLKPDVGHVAGHSKAKLEVSFYPGKLGQMKGSCFVQIGEIEPIKIDVEVFGVFPQIFLHLPKDIQPLGSKLLEPCVEYVSIAKMNECHAVPEKYPSMDKDLISNCESDWEIVTYEDGFPTIQEICIAIEKHTATICIRNNLDFLPMVEKCTSIPGFVVTPYVVDVGNVLIGEESTYSVLLENCSSLIAQVYLPKDSKEIMAKVGLTLSIPWGSRLQPGRVAAIYISFLPVKEIYPHKFQKIDLTLFLEIIYGSRIPIRVLANITYPFLTVNKKSLNFGEVKCGHCKVLQIEFANVGWVDCSWKVDLELTNKKDSMKMPLTPDINQNSLGHLKPYSISPQEGNLSPGEHQKIKVLFEPTYEGLYKGRTIIRIRKNSSPIVLKMNGTGQDPILNFNKSLISFDPLIPLIERSKQVLIIENPNKYPVEIFLPAFDRQRIEKELIFNLLLHHYKVEELLVPIYGNELPVEYKEFLNWKIESLQEKIQKQNDDVIINERAGNSQRKTKTSKSRKASNYSVFEEKHQYKSDTLSESEQLALKENLLHSYLHGDMKELMTEKESKDPIKNVLNKISTKFEEKTSFTPPHQMEAIYIFHGAPFSDYVHLAHRVSCILEKPVIDLDTVLLREIVLGDSPASFELKHLLIKKINDFFSKFPGKNVYQLSLDRKSAADMDEDPVEEFSNRLATYLNKCGNSRFSSKVNKNLKVYKSPEKDLEIILWSDTPDNLYLPNIPTALIEGILTARLCQLDCRNGFVIPKLKSIFFQNLEDALTSILNATYRIYSIEVVFINNTFEQHMEKLRQEKICRELFDVMRMFLDNIKDRNVAFLAKKIIPMPYINDEVVIEGQKEDVDAFEKLFYHDAPYRHNLIESDLYLEKIKQKVRLLRKFSQINEFVESELQKELINKKLPKFKDKRKSGYVPSKTRMNSKASKKSTTTSLFNEGIRPNKRASTVFEESKIMDKVSSQKSTIEFLASDASPKGLPENGIEVTEESDLRNQFDDYSNVLIKLLHLLENWPIKSTKKSLNKSKTSIEAKVKSSKMSKKSKSVLSEDEKSTLEVDLLPLKNVGIPVIIVNSPSIEAALTKKFLEFKYMKNISKLPSPDDISAINYISGKIKEIEKETTYLHIRKTRMNKKYEKIDDAFTIEFLNSMKVNGSQETEESTGSLRVQESLEYNFHEDETKDLFAESENKISTKTHNRKTGKSKDLSKSREEGIEARHVLQSQETVSFVVYYHPQDKGEHNSILTVEMEDWQKRYEVNIHGLCDIPEIDRRPEIIFEKCAEEKPKTCPPVYSPSYFHDIKAFDFGLLLVEKKLDEQYTRVVSKLAFHNISHVSLRAEFQLDKEALKAFSIDRESIEVKAKEIGYVHVKAFVKRALRYSGTLICTIRNNPDKMMVKLSCLGFLPEVEIFPKQLQFDPVLLFHKNRLQFTLKNKCAITLSWKVSSTDLVFWDEFDVNPNNGILPCFSSLPLEIEYSPSKVQPLFKKQLQIEFYHPQEDSQVLIAGTLVVSAESYDVLIDLQFAKSNDSSGKQTESMASVEVPNHLNFGLTKASLQKNMLIILKNNGKYDVLYKFIKNDEYSRTPFFKNLYDIFKLEPDSGMLAHGSRSPTVIEVGCLAENEFEVDNIPLYVCQVTDTNVSWGKKIVVANIPIFFSLTSLFSKYSIFPSPEVNFGPLKINSQSSLHFTIHNKGILDFTFSVVNPELVDHVIAESHSGKVTSAAQKKGATSKSLKLGYFTITPSSGIVLPDESAVVTVFCLPSMEGKIKEVVHIKISNSPPGHKDELNLIVNSCIPSINFFSPEEMFVEHIICEDFNAFKWPSELNQYTIYSKKNNELAFKNALVGCCMKARLFLRNASLINTSAKISILPLKERCRIGCHHYNGKYMVSHEECKQFSVKPEKVMIPSGSGKWISIMFTPVAMEVYAATLCISVDVESNESFSSDDYTESDEDISEYGEVTDEEDEMVEEILENLEPEEIKIIAQDEKESLFEDENKDSGKGKVEVEVKDKEREARFRENIFKYIIADEGNEWNEPSTAEVYVQGQEIGYNEKEYFEDNLEESFANNGDRFSSCIILSGEGLLPMLRLTQPSQISENSAGKYSIILPPINLGSVKSLKFGFQNMSYIICKVLIELTGKEDIFVLHPTDTSAKLIKKFQTGVPSKNVTKVELKPREEIVFDIQINAKFPGVFTEGIHIIPVGNPFGSIIFTVEAEFIRSGIILDGLTYADEYLYTSSDTVEDFSNLKNKSLLNFSIAEKLPSVDKLLNSSEEEVHSSENLILVKHLLEFRENYPGKFKVKEFRLVNYSQVIIFEISYDFEWIGLESISKLQITPRKGVLRPLSSMPISAVFSSDNPVWLNKVLIKCFLERAVEYCHIKEDITKLLGRIQYKDLEEENIIKLIEGNTLTVSDFSERCTRQEKIDEIRLTSEESFIDDNLRNEGGRKTLQVKSLELKNNKEWQGDIFSHAEEKADQIEDIGKDYVLLPLLFQASVDYSSYSCDIHSEIFFGTVAVGMSNTCDVTLMNTGKVPVKFHWKFETLNALNFKSVANESVVIADTKQGEALTEAEKKCIESKDVLDPFFAIPSKGELCAAGDFIVCKIIFSPLELGDYESSLVCSVENLPPGMIDPKASLKGKARHLPYYFKYEGSDSVGNRGRKESTNGKETESSSLPDSKMVYIEVNCIGVGHTFHKTLDFYNYTDKKAIFNWKNVDSIAKCVPEWSCSKLSGVVPPRSKIPMKFYFTPSKIGLFESLWSFNIFDDNKKIKFPIFHLFGISSDPAVYFLPGFIKMKLYYQGMKLYKDIHLVNEEDIPLKFKMDTSSCSLKNKRGVLKIKPTKGLLSPHAKQLIRVKYFSYETGVTNFHVKFLIERRLLPLVLTVKCGSYEFIPDVEFFEPLSSVKVRLVNKEVNCLNFGKMREGDVCQGFFEISNKGCIPFKYDWNYSKDLAKKIGLGICFSPLKEIVYPSSTITCSVSLSVVNSSKVKNFKVLLKISQGPHYVIYLNMVTERPKYIFSFKSYDFGKCIVPPAGILPKFKEVILSIKGKDKEALMLESKFQSIDYLIAHLEKTVLFFDEEIQVPIRFFPLEMLKYEEKIPFVINGKWEEIVVVKGEGIPIRLELVNPNQKYIDFKCVEVGCKVTKKISIRNSTDKSINASFKIRKHCSQVEVNQKYLEGKSCRSYPIQSSLNDGFIELVPVSEINLKSGNVIDLYVTFSPTIKLTGFSKEIVAVMSELEGEIPLCLIHGRSKDTDVTLTSGCIQFGNVVRGSSSVRLLSIINKGHKRTKYQWDPEGVLDSQFSITPTSGYCCPRQNVSFKLMFTPGSVNKLTECKIICHLQGQRDLPLELSGRGIELPQIKDTITFSAPVREKESKLVNITNRSEYIVEVKPLLKGDHFLGADVMVLKPYVEATYLITYAPITLTKEGKEHQGLFYLCLPNGDEYSWNLLGKTSPPLPSSDVKYEVNSKLWHEEILTVQNWLPILQRFHVTSELIPGEYSEPTFYISGFVKNLKSVENISRNLNNKEGVGGEGLKKKKSKGKTSSISSNISIKNQKFGGFGEPGGYLDVPGNSSSQYKLKFICYEECSLDFKVIFTNQDTGEYLYHKINYTVKDVSPQVIEINTVVRKEAFHKLEIENPFPSLPLIFNVRTELSFISTPETITVGPNQKETIHLRCLPLHEGYFTAPLFISCTELGIFNYELRVNVEYAESIEHKEMCFTAPLGKSETLYTPPFLHNYADKLANFTCVVDSEAFLVKEFVQIMPHAQKALKVTFEPTNLGSFYATLSCKSEVAGSFFKKLKGICVPPKIEGPYIVEANSDGTKIPFKNVFTEATQFSFRVTEPFQLDSNLKILESKEETAINVSFNSNTVKCDKVSNSINGSLVISLTNEMPLRLKWEYYLKGIYV